MPETCNVDRKRRWTIHLSAHDGFCDTYGEPFWGSRADAEREAEVRADRYEAETAAIVYRAEASDA